MVFAMMNLSIDVIHNFYPWNNTNNTIRLGMYLLDWQVLTWGISQLLAAFCYSDYLFRTLSQIPALHDSDWFPWILNQHLSLCYSVRLDGLAIMCTIAAAMVRIGRTFISRRAGNQRKGVLSQSSPSYTRKKFSLPAVDWMTSYYLSPCAVFAAGLGATALIASILSEWLAVLFTPFFFWYMLPTSTGRTPTARSHHAPLAGSSTVKTWVTCTASSLLSLEVDYSKSTAQVYRDVAKATMTIFRSLECFSYVLHETHFREEFSTWAPCWDQGSTQIKLLSSC